MTRHPARLRSPDVVVAVGCWALAVAVLAVLPLLADLDPEAGVGVPRAGRAAWWWALGVLTGQGVALLWRRRRPEAVVAASSAAVPLGAAAGMGGALGLTSLAVLVAVYALATRRDLRPTLPLLAASTVVVAVGHTVAGLRDDVPAGTAIATGLLQAVLLVGLPVAVAALVVARRESRAAQEDRLRALEREQDALMQAAVARERTAMARELHDIAAHHLTGIAVMSAAIATQIDTDPGAAKAAVADVRRQSTAVLRDLRNLVGLLRDHDDPAAADGVRAETLAGISDLVGSVVAAGQDVVLTVVESPERRPLGSGVGPLAQLAAYRMVQEALANAGRHAPGSRCDVEVDDRGSEALVVTVRNAPGPPVRDPAVRGGLGLVGMRERAELTGSTVEAGATPDGGWLVRLRTPRSEPEGGS